MAAALLACVGGEATTATKSWPELPVSAEQARMEMPGAVYTEPANAADVDHVYLPGEFQEGATVIPCEFLKLDVLKPETDEQRTLVDRAIQELVTESRRSSRR